MADETPQDIFAGYPDWLRVAITATAAALGLWILSKVLKWSLGCLAVVVLACGAVLAAWLLLH